MEFTKEENIEFLKTLGEILPDEQWNSLFDDVMELMAPYEPMPEAEEIKEVLATIQKKRELRSELNQQPCELPRLTLEGRISPSRRRTRLGINGIRF